ncbi:MAG TPA: hypothetical protein VNU97_12840 [Rhizomicrobium sp.]|nr:hypothetical protein [Rhizomicrobium sp.]
MGALLLPVATTTAYAALPTVATDIATGNVTVTLANGTVVQVSASLASQIAAAMQSGDAAAVTDAIKALVLANAANDNDLATAIYILAVNSTGDASLKSAAYAGVVAGDPNAATQVAANSSGPPGGNVGGQGGTGGGDVADNGFPSGGTSGGGSSPSVDTP